MVFQDYALFPHMTVADNVGYGLADRRHGDAGGRGARPGRAERLGGPHAARALRRRAAAGGPGRALAPDPTVILLDEPFSNLDATLRDRMRRDVRRILKEAGATAVFVTHDQEEALAIADVVAVMRSGRVLQVGYAAAALSGTRRSVGRRVHRRERVRAGRRRRRKRGDRPRNFSPDDGACGARCW